MQRAVETMGKRVRFARKKRSLSQEELSALAGIKQPNLSKIERGEIQKTTDIGALSRALRVPVAWLELDDQPEPDWNDPGGAQVIPLTSELLRHLAAMDAPAVRALENGLRGQLGMPLLSVTPIGTQAKRQANDK